MKNLIKLYEQMTNKELTAGMCWYTNAHEYAEFLGQKYGLHTHRVAGIISALSPSCSWDRNRKEAEWLIQSNFEGFEMEPFNFTTYGQGVIKAQRIYSGEEFEWFNEKTGAKTYNFYHNIALPYNPDYLTVDRHCYYTAMGRYSNRMHLALYRKIADHYKKAAKKIGILPNQLQAILWVGVQNDLI